AGAWHARRLDEQDVATDRRPSEPGGDARNAGAHRGFALELRRTENRGKVAARNADRSALTFGDTHRGMAQHLTDLAFETAHAGFARIVLDDLAQRLVVDLGLAGLKTVRLGLAADQITMRDLHLLVGGVTGERDDLHAVAQRAGNGVEHVRGGNEDHAAQIER